MAYPAPPPFDIPRVRFVDAGLALSYALGVTRYSKVGSIRTTFLIEEFIEGGNNNFIKYIHNLSATPLLDPDEEGYELALFFSFTQHVQYVKTGGLAFIGFVTGMADPHGYAGTGTTRIRVQVANLATREIWYPYPYPCCGFYHGYAGVRVPEYVRPSSVFQISKYTN